MVYRRGACRQRKDEDNKYKTQEYNRDGMNSLQRKEIGNIPADRYTHKVPKSFFCVQCGERHKYTDKKFQHYYNSHCHKQ